MAQKKDLYSQLHFVINIQLSSKTQKIDKIIPCLFFADSPFPGIIREVWKNTPGENLTTLKTNPDFPNNPTTIEIIENFDAPFNVESDYGSKLKGYFIAPETGNNTFYMACSRSCELLFSGDEDTKNKTTIILLNKPTWHNQWSK